MRLSTSAFCLMGIAVVAVATTGIMGCGGGSEPVAIQFPEATVPVQTSPTDGKSADTGGGVTSQGDPSQYSQ